MVNGNVVIIGTPIHPSPFTHTQSPLDFSLVDQPCSTFSSMSARLPADLLDRTPPEAARLLALSHLHDAADARKRLDDTTDPEALHDFRVAIRHLREVCRAYRPQLKGSVGRKARRRLRQITNDTNALRDAEVQLEWLKEHREAMPVAAQEAPDLLRDKLERRQQRDNESAAALDRPWNRVARKLERSLRQCTTEVDPEQLGPRPTFRAVTAQLIAGQVAELRRALALVETIADQQQAHQARIAGKRLRYLLEPIPGADQLIDRLKQLQDDIGHLHDLQILGDEVQRTLGRTEDAAQRAGLTARGMFAAGRAEELFAQVQGDWFGDHAHELLDQIADFAARLEGTTGAAPAA